MLKSERKSIAPWENPKKNFNGGEMLTRSLAAARFPAQPPLSKWGRKRIENEGPSLTCLRKQGKSTKKRWDPTAVAGIQEAKDPSRSVRKYLAVGVNLNPRLTVLLKPVIDGGFQVKVRQRAGLVVRSLTWLLAL